MDSVRHVTLSEHSAEADPHMSQYNTTYGCLEALITDISPKRVNLKKVLLELRGMKYMSVALTLLFFLHSQEPVRHVTLSEHTAVTWLLNYNILYIYAGR